MTRPTVGGALVGLVVTMVVVGGCGGSSSLTTKTEPTPTTPTFTRDIAPILFRECAPCHRPGEAAPFSVLTYSDVRQRARAIVTATASRLMPPWLPEAGYGEFAGERRLGETEIDTIRRWHEQGAAEGDPANLPPLPVFAEGWRLGEPDLVIKLPRPYTLPAATAEIWRNFVLPAPVTATRFVRTMEMRPGNARVVHHALLGIDQTRSSRRRDEKDAEPGFEGMDMGDSQSPDGHLLGWSPGMSPFPGIEGKAWRLDPGSDLVLQLHLTPSGKPEAIDPVLGLFFADRSPDGASLHLMRLDADQAIDIPAGEEHFVVSDTFELPVDLDVLAVYPHAHFLARTMEAAAKLPDGTTKWLIRIDDWDFKWQDIYRLRSPVFLPKGSTISMKFGYDNSAGNPRNPNRPPRRVVAGLRSSDEMAHLQLQVAPRSVESAVVLREALYRHALRKNPEDAWAYYELGNALRDRGEAAEAIRQYRSAIARDPAHAAARNNLGVALSEQNETGEAIGQYRQALRSEPDFADAHYNLANALRSRGNVDEAIRHYREALRLEPGLAAAHNNLGEVLASQGKLVEAIDQFARALGLQPDSAEAHNNLGASLGLQGKLDEAIEHFRQALRLNPAHAGAQRNLKIAMDKAAAK